MGGMVSDDGNPVPARASWQNDLLALGHFFRNRVVSMGGGYYVPADATDELRNLAKRACRSIERAGLMPPLSLDRDADGEPIHKAYEAVQELLMKSDVLSMNTTRHLSVRDQSPTEIAVTFQAAIDDAERIIAKDVGECPAPPCTIPELDTTSGKWIKNKLAAVREGIQTETLQKYRDRVHGQWTADDQMSGIDRDGRMWRRCGTPRNHPWYFVPSLKAKKPNS